MRALQLVAAQHDVGLDLLATRGEHLLGVAPRPGLALVADVLGHVLDAMDDERRPPVRARHRGVDRAPPALLPAAARGLRATDRVALHRQHVGAAEILDARERGAHVAHAVGVGVGGVVREDVEQAAALELLAGRHRRLEIRLAHRDDLVLARREHRVAARGALEERAVVAARRVGLAPRLALACERLLTLVLGALALADVLREREHRPAPVELDRVPRDLDREEPPVLRAMAPLAGTLHADARERDRLAQRRDLLGRADVGDRHREELVAGVAVVLHGGGVDLEEAQRLAVVDPGGLRVVREQQPVLRFARLEPGLREPLLGDVLGDGDEALLRAPSVADGRHADARPDHAAVLREVALLDDVAVAAAVAQIGEQRDVVTEVVRVGDRLEVERAQLVLGVAEHPAESLVRLEEASVGRADRDAGRGLAERAAEALLARAQRFLALRVLHGEAHQVHGAIDDLLLGGGRVVRRAVVDGEGREHTPVGVQHRRGPAGAQAVLQGEVAVVVPQGIGRDVGDQHRLLAVGRRAAASGVRTDRLAVDRGDVGRRQVRCRSVPDVRALVVEQQHGDDSVAQHVLDAERGRLEDLAQRASGRDPREDLRLAALDPLEALVLRDVARHAENRDDRTVGVAQRRRVGLHPAFAPLEADDAEPHLAALAAGHAPVQRGEALAVLGVDQLEHVAAGDLLERRGLDHAQTRGVHLEEPTVRRDRLHALRLAVDDRTQARLARAQRVLRELALRDVHVRDHDAAGLVLVERRGHHAEPAALDRRVAGVLERELARLTRQHAADAGGDRVRLGGARALRTVADLEVARPHASMGRLDRVGDAEASPGFVHRDHDAALVEQGDVRRESVEDCRVRLVELAHALVGRVRVGRGAAPQASTPLRIEHLLDGGAESLEVALWHEVVRAAPDRLDRAFLTPGFGKVNARNLEPARAQQFDHAQRVEPRRDVRGEDHVGQLPLERAQQVDLGRHTPCREAHAGPAQGAADAPGLLLVAFDQQDRDRLRAERSSSDGRLLHLAHFMPVKGGMRASRRLSGHDRPRWDFDGPERLH